MTTKIEIIAEIAQGYEGSPELAELLVNGAIKANADAVKVQAIYADELCTPCYQHYPLFKSLEMDFKVWEYLVGITHLNNKKFYLDIFGQESINLAKKLRVDGVKITATDSGNLKFVQQVCKEFDNVFLSIGGMEINHLKKIIDSVELPKKFSLVFGFQAEPTQLDENNLGRIRKIKEILPNIKIGFMDHTLGSSRDSFYVPIVAIGLGIASLEKHITLDYALKLEDYISALSIDRFKDFVGIFRAAEKAVGDDSLELTVKEIEYKNKANKVPIATISLPAGHVLTENDICFKRAGGDINNFFSIDSELIGKTLISAIQGNSPFIKSKHL